MKAIKRIGKIIIINIVITMTVLSNISYGGYTVEQVGNAIAGYAQEYVTKGNEKQMLRYDLANGKYKYSEWDPEVTTAPDGLHYFCCATFVSCIYEKVAGIQIRDHSVSGIYSNASSKGFSVHAFNSSELQPGDILIRSGAHTGIYIGNGKKAHASTSNASITEQVLIADVGSNWNYYLRVTSDTASNLTQLNETCSLTGASSSTGGTAINYSNFFFNGIPDGKYSLASKKGLLSTIIDFLANIIDYLIGILTYIIRIVFVGWTAIFENLLNWTFQSATSTNTDPAEAGISPTEVKKTETSDRKVTIEKLIFNKFELFDINIFE